MNVQEDVEFLNFLGVDSYRLSISWSRISPSKFKLLLSLCRKQRVTI